MGESAGVRWIGAQEKHSAAHEPLAKHMPRGPNNYDPRWAMQAWRNMPNTKAVLGNKLRWTREEMLSPLCIARGPGKTSTTS